MGCFPLFVTATKAAKDTLVQSHVTGLPLHQWIQYPEIHAKAVRCRWNECQAGFILKMTGA